MLSTLAMPPVDGADAPDLVEADWRYGQAKQVIGSPHFFTDDDDFFCPSMTIERAAGVLNISFDQAGFEDFIERTLP